MARDRIAAVLKDARLRAGLSQRALARRACTAQSVVARIELGEASPTWHTITRLLAAAGFDLNIRLAVGASLDDIVRSKKAADRPQDRQEVLALREMRRGRKRGQ